MQSIRVRLVLLLQLLHALGATAMGFSDWRPILIAYLLWVVAFGAGQILTRGERGQRALFLLPAVFFTVANLSGAVGGNMAQCPTAHHLARWGDLSREPPKRGHGCIG